jgi:DNA polymerase III subunit beta
MSMRFAVETAALLKPLSSCVRAIEKRAALPILSNILLRVVGGQLEIEGNNLEMAIQASVPISAGEDGEISVNAKKLLDICKAFPEPSDTVFSVSENGRATLRAGKSRCTLATLPGDEYPSLDGIEPHSVLEMRQSVLRELLKKTAIAMAQEDVRHYLVGVLLEIGNEDGVGYVRAVATDGHRLAYSSVKSSGYQPSGDLKAIIPRNSVIELIRSLQQNDKNDKVDKLVKIFSGTNKIRLELSEEMLFASKIIDYNYPEYQRVIPSSSSKVAVIETAELRGAVRRVLILSNEKIRGITMDFDSGRVEISAKNETQEEASEEVPVQYEGDPLKISMNGNYLIDALEGIEQTFVTLGMTTSDGSVLIRGVGDTDTKYVIMPMRL